MINYLALLVALSLSGVSGYYSIVGLAAIFSSAFYPVIFMGCVLEAGKLVTASWLYNNWSLAPTLLKCYLTSAVVMLMFITSMGIFGFLSKAHIEQTVQLNSGSADQVKIIQSKIEFENDSIADVNKQIAQIDAAISKLTDKGQASSSLKAADAQRKTRNALAQSKQTHIEVISTLNQQKLKLDTDIKRAEAEVGPLKYIAELIYENADTNQLEKSVRFVIIILVLVFDPLAVILLIAANVGIRAAKPQILKPILKPPVEAHKVFHIDDKIWENNEQTIWQEPEEKSTRADSSLRVDDGISTTSE
ncbi:MAG: hypothetical protein ACXV2C_00410 [Candidatus Bathyarchaeia archaeon]